MGLQLDVIGLVVADMGKSLAFYRRLGLDIPAGSDGEPHVDAALPGGLRLAFDTIDPIHSFDPEWAPPSGSPRAALAFRCDSPAEVDQGVRRPGRSRVRGAQGAVGRVLGDAVRRG